MKYNIKEFQKLLEKKFPEEEIKILEFTGISKKGEIYCSLCQKKYSIYKMSILLKDGRKSYCPKCFLSKNTKKCLEEISFSPNLSFLKISYNKKTHKPTIIYKCGLCQSVNEKSHIEFLKHPTCMYCGKNAKKMNTSGFKKELLELELPFEIIGEYNKSDKKVLLKHNNCGYIFNARPHDILTKHTGCPRCSRKTSRGEQKIIDLLEEFKIDYIREKVFKWSNKKRYDFYIPKYKILIEYQGIQHFKTVNNYWLSLSEQQKIDTFKKEQALKNGYFFFTINYTDFDIIPQILVQRLSEYGVAIKREKETPFC